MNTAFSQPAWIIFLSLAATVSSPAALADKTPATVEAAPVPKSTFSIPAKPQDGNDPFFPGSGRLFAAKTPSKTPTSGRSGVLVFNGISGTQEHRLAMINSHTMAEGEEADVNTSTGRAKVRLLEIKGEIAVVEVAGERRELRFQNR